MQKYKLWVAVDESGDFYVFLGEKPTFDPKFGEWRNDSYRYGSEYIHAGHNKELKAGDGAIKEIEFELPTIGEKEDAPKGLDLYVAVDEGGSAWIYPDEPSNFGSYWNSLKGGVMLGPAKGYESFEKSLCKVHTNVPYEIVIN